MLILCAVGALAAWQAHAQFRALPANAKRVTIGQQQYPLPYIDLGGTAVRLAAGGIIYDQNNRTIVHGALPAGADAVYTLDINGDIARIWILTPQESAQLSSR